MTIRERNLPDGYYGIYYHPKRLIVLDEGLLEYQQKCALCHELVHAYYGDDGCFISTKAEIRARKVTALRLISLEDYKALEKIYSNMDYLIACELEVTLEILQDYKRYYLENLFCKSTCYKHV
ncbi:ImmA/IrrE family metallo-endopeptidase [Gardnerella vaginalis]|uniref:ImmA/IrrE family metallo-endopeptidase n=1 Tax=Gardnerella vaginalis TaxID=2702 RepID=UPI0031FEA22F